ncbi:arsenate reductase ArsC [Microbispora sp. NBC_01189]|uniref:arsenate-mycothiol transferase ArsC n=1 Tax=Microbispora sp. NBC_01189 TaxID=2903583 RepID=UPI002E12869B
MTARHAGRFSAETVQHLLAETSRVHVHLVVLAERLTAERLDALAHTEDQASSATPRVLFVCSRNAGRSQMAAALPNVRAGGHVIVSSAGTDPAAEIEPEVAQVLTESGITPTDAYPKPLTDEIVKAADIVVTIGCGDAFPVVPGRRYLDWPIPDPDGASPEAVRAIRDAIDAHITDLLATLSRA